MNENKLLYKDTVKLNKFRKNKNKSKIFSDISGSYTGKPLIYTQPTQDADDL